MKVATEDEQYLIEIANCMRIMELPEKFVLEALATALEYEGVADLMRLWDNEESLEEQNLILKDIEEMIKDCSYEGLAQ